MGLVKIPLEEGSTHRNRNTMLYPCPVSTGTIALPTQGSAQSPSRCLGGTTSGYGSRAPTQLICRQPAHRWSNNKPGPTTQGREHTDTRKCAIPITQMALGMSSS